MEDPVSALERVEKTVQGKYQDDRHRLKPKTREERRETETREDIDDESLWNKSKTECEI